MGYYENRLKSIAAGDGFSMPSAALLSSELNQFAALLGKIQGSLGWTGSSAESAKEHIDSLRRAFGELADMTDGVQRNYRAANSVVDDAVQALDTLPGMEVPQFLVDAAKIGADVFYGGQSRPAKEAIDSAADTLSAGREEAAKAALTTLKRELHEKRIELNKILKPISAENKITPDPTDVRGGRPIFDGGDGSGSDGSGSGDDYFPSGRSSFQPYSADTTVPAVSSPGSTGSGSTGAGAGVGVGDGVHRLRPDGSVSPSDPRGVEGHTSGGLSGAAGVGSGRVDLGGKSATTAFGGSGGIGAGILGAGGIGAGARLASGGLKGLSGGAGGSAGAGAGRSAGGIGAGAGARLAGGGTGAIGSSSASGGGARLGGTGGGLSGAAASSAAHSGPSANIGATGTGGAPGTGAGSTGIMGGGGAPSTSQERRRTRGLGGLIAPKLVDDDEPAPRSAAAGPGSRDGN